MSFDRLVDGHYSTVYNIAYRMLGDSQTAADATQIAFVKAFEALPNFRGDAAFKTWLYRIVVNVCLDEIRRREHQPLSLTTEEDEGQPPLAEREVPDESDEPAGLAEQANRPLMRSHPLTGAQMAATVPGLYGVAEIIRGDGVLG